MIDAYKTQQERLAKSMKVVKVANRQIKNGVKGFVSWSWNERY